MNEMDMMAPSKIAEQYGGNKQKIANAVQMGIVNPTVAVMAGMFIDRMRGAAAQEQVPQQTVAQQVMGPPQMQPQMAPQMSPQMPQGSGLAALPVPDDMFPGEGYAGGGMVAFSDGGEPRFQVGGQPVVPTMMPPGMRRGEDPQVLRAYYISRGLPIPPALMSEAEKAAVSKEPYPAGVFPKIGRAASDVGGAVSNFIAPQGFGYYQDAQQATAPTGRVNLGDNPEAMRRQALTAVAPAPLAPAPLAPAPRAVSAAPAPQAIQAPNLQTLTPEEFRAEQAKFGVTDSADKTIQSIMDKLSGESAGDREQAKNMAFLQSGLAIMGGTSPYAFENIGKGASVGLAQYGKDIKDIKAAERDLSKLQVEQAKAADARTRGDFAEFKKRNETIEDLKIKLRKLGVDERVAQAQIAQASRPGASAELVQTYLKNPEAFNAAMAASRPSSAENTTALNRLRYADAALQNDLTYLSLSRSKKPAEQEKAKAIRDEIYARYGVTPSSNTQLDPLGLRGGR
jgi:hypothetical protein